MQTTQWDTLFSLWPVPQRRALWLETFVTGWPWTKSPLVRFSKRFIGLTDKTISFAVSATTEAEPHRHTDTSPACFEQLLSDHGDTFKRVAATYESNAAKQQELFQEICLAVWLAVPAFKGASTLKTYMLRIAHNRSVQHVAAEVKHGQIGNTDDPDGFAANCDTHTELEQQQSSALLMRLVRSLPIQQRQVFALLMEGLAYKDIAEITGLTTQNVGVTIMRVKQTLKEGMSDGK